MSKGNPHRGRPRDQRRWKALEAGAITYRGNACKHSHDGVRYVSTGACVACYSGKVSADEFSELFE